MSTTTFPSPTRRPAGQPAVTVVPAECGERLTVVGDRVQMKLDSRVTRGACNLWIETVPPGGGPPPHLHHAEDEIFIVLEGELTFWSERGPMKAGPGAVVHAPRESAHTFRNAGPGTARMYVFTTPGGFDGFFREVSRPGDDEHAAFPPTPADIERVMAAAPRHGIEFLPPGESAGDHASSANQSV